MNDIKSLLTILYDVDGRVRLATNVAHVIFDGIKNGLTTEKPDVVATNGVGGGENE